MTRPTYEHRAGQTFRDGVAITEAEARADAENHRNGAKAIGAMRCETAKRVSEGLADQAEHALGAKEIFDRIAKPSRDQERQREAAVKRSRQAKRQARGMRG